MENKEKDVVPRLEFRAFASHFGRVIDEIRQRSACAGIAESRDIYLITAVNDSHNVKIRHNQLDIKELIGVEQGLERWRPQIKLDFPAAADTIEANVFPALNIPTPSLPEGEITVATFLQKVLWPHPDLRLAQVFKRRFFFTIDGCQVEITELTANGATLQTIAVEQEDATAVLAVKNLIGLAPYENVNYLLALKRIMGLAPLPAPTWQMNGGE